MSENNLSIFKAPRPGTDAQGSPTQGPTTRLAEDGVAPRALARCSSREARALLPFEQAIALRALPLGSISHRGREVLSVAVDQERLVELKSSLRFATGRELKLVPLPEGVVLEAIFHAYRGDEQRLNESLSAVRERDVPRASDPLEIPQATGEAAQFLDALIDYALSKDASDIHIIPRVDGTTVRLRIKGELLSSPSLFGAVYHSQIINRLKILSSLDTSQHHLPQDGSFPIRLPHGECRIRINTMPTLHGEKAVLRCVGARGIHTIDALQLSTSTQSMLDDFLRKKEGALLLAGPTGSGKTTTMYAVVHELASKNLNVVSVEDPIELPIPGITQSAVDEKIGLSYAVSLRALLRQDPDAILIGEIRDAESAAIAYQAALTGHLIISTVHARSVFDVFLRLQHLGLDPLTVAQGSELILCQRLVPRLCEKCKVIDLARSNIRGFSVFRKIGCTLCDYTGFAGKLLVCESLRVNAELRKILSPGFADKERLLSYCSESNYCDTRRELARAEKSGIIEECEPTIND